MTTAVPPGARGGGAPSPPGPADVIDTTSDEGLVIDAHIVIAGVDAYLRIAQAVSRPDISTDSKGLPELTVDMAQNGAGRKARGAVEPAASTLGEFAGTEDQPERPSGRTCARERN